MADRSLAPTFAILMAMSVVAPVAAGTLSEADRHTIDVAGLSLGGDAFAEGLPAISPTHPHHARSLTLSNELLTTHQESNADPFAHAIDLAKRASLGQAKVMGYPPTAPVALAGYQLPSDALRELAARRSVALSSDQIATLRDLDGLAAPLRISLARFVDAFLALDDAATVHVDLADVGSSPQAAIQSTASILDPQMVAGRFPPHLLVSDRQSPAEALEEAGVDWSRLFPTRVQFLDAILALRSVVEMTNSLPRGACEPVQVPLAFSIDLEGCDNTYPIQYVLLLDVGGDDRYYNNAGGSNIYGGFFCGLLPGGRAALVDLGQGHDAYGDPKDLRACGVNGGGFIGGMGFLLDGGGDDTYISEYIATGGGGHTLGTGFLLDVDGDDVFDNGPGGTNGGGANGGLGLLMDTGGNDRYVGGRGTTNGGAGGVELPTLGFLIDMDGDDFYTSGGDWSGVGSNGGGINLGLGFLLDAAGNDRYTAASGGTNGGGTYGGAGFLLDADGSDMYTAMDFGTNGGGDTGGQGRLVDLGGNDMYVASRWGTNGGGCAMGAGVLFDAWGDDTYIGEEGGTNGGGGLCRILNIPVGVGFGSLVDGGGRDVYRDTLTECVDCSIVPKEIAGFQVDLNIAGPR